MAQACEHVGKGVSQSKTKTDYYIDEQMKETVVINLTDESDTDSSYTYIAPP